MPTNPMNKVLAEILMEKSPEFIARPLNVLNNNKKEMEKVNKIGADNYYHRKAMCENAQNGYGDAITSFLLGLAKEGYDFYNKNESINNNGTQSTYTSAGDSWKDIKNNFEGIILGLKNPNKDCKILLEGLDWRTNTWKKQSK